MNFLFTVSDNRVKNRQKRIITDEHTHINRQVDHLPICFYIVILNNRLV